MKKKFERFVTYLATTAVLFAIFYVLTPGLAERFINPALPYLGPIILVGLVYLAWKDKPEDKKEEKDKPEESKQE